MNGLVCSGEKRYSIRSHVVRTNADANPLFASVTYRPACGCGRAIATRVPNTSPSPAGPLPAVDVRALRAASAPIACAAATMGTSIRNGTYIQLAPPDERPAIFSTTSAAVEKSGARKNTHATHTNPYVRHRLPIFAAHAAVAVCSRALLPRTNLWTASPTPCSTPQKTNVQLAPCHRPPRSMVTRRFAYVRSSP